jgi:hypothetical protein
MKNRNWRVKAMFWAETIVTVIGIFNAVVIFFLANQLLGTLMMTITILALILWMSAHKK